MELAVLLAVVVFAALVGVPYWRKGQRTVRIAPSEVGLVYGPEGYERDLPPGLHKRFDPEDKRIVYPVNLVTRALPGQTIEAISQDQFAFRLVLTPVVTVTDPRALIEQTGAPAMIAPQLQNDIRYDRLHPALASAALTAVAARTLEAFLAEPQAIVAEIAPLLAPALPGTRLDELLLTGITLPPEVRKMFTEVERARREGLAALERARSEQASLRALANAARNIADNPGLAHLRTLQMMETAKGAKTFVLGNKPDDTPA